MSLQVTPEPNDIYVLQIRDVLKRSEFAAGQKDVARKIDIGSKPRILAILENFEGWERGADWNDLEFLITNGGEIVKVAVVAGSALGSAGAGVCRRRSSWRTCEIFLAGGIGAGSQLAQGIASSLLFHQFFFRSGEFFQLFLVNLRISQL